MPCNSLDLGNGDVAIVCTRGRKSRKLCKVCSRRPATRLCDFPLSGSKKGKTCDRDLCSSCAVKVGPDRDLCPPHAELEKRQQTLPLGDPAIAHEEVRDALREADRPRGKR